MRTPSAKDRHEQQGEGQHSFANLHRRWCWRRLRLGSISPIPYLPSDREVIQVSKKAGRSEGMCPVWGLAIRGCKARARWRAGPSTERQETDLLNDGDEARYVVSTESGGVYVDFTLGVDQDVAFVCGRLLWSGLNDFDHAVL